MIDQINKLFEKYRDSLGLPDREDLERQCDFEDELAALLCQHYGHNLIPDHCGKPEHDYCVRCSRRREELDQ